MSEEQRDNVEPIPVRLNLPSEIAALALPHREGEAPIVVLNANEENQRATFTLFRLEAFVAAAIAWVGARVARWARNHQIATSAITATATSVAIVTGSGVAVDGERLDPAALPPQTITIMSAQPPVTVTATPARTRATRTAKPSSKAVSTAGPTLQPIVLTERQEPTVKPTSKPTARNTAKPTTGPTVKQPSASKEPTAPPTQEVPATQAPPEPSPSPEPPPNTPPAQEPDSTTAQARCAVRVDLDPILDLCVLS